MEPSQTVEAERLPLKLYNNPGRIIPRPFVLGAENRLHHIVGQVLSLEPEAVTELLDQVYTNFSGRHEDIRRILRANHDHVIALTGWSDHLTEEQQLLIGSYFTMEYAVESAALFNPSIVSHPDQTGAPDGGVRFLMSLRATGEGHVSSVVFRCGAIGPDNAVTLEPPARYSSPVRPSPDQYYLKPLFRRKLSEMAGNLASIDLILNPLPEKFTFTQLQQAISDADGFEYKPALFAETAESILWLARSNYQLKVPPQADLSEVVVFPTSQSESHGIEDLRLVQFTDEDGSQTYFGSYTAYNGVRVLPMLLETQDFREIHIHTLNGACARNKGLALFPRRINGHYVMCSRIDGQNLYIMYSDYVHFWESATLLARPEYPWELMLMGNCGSPIETDEGWLLITHGVGPMRRYCIGAMLLDKDDPTRIIGRLREPLMAPTDEEREGYTPNVLYSCGALRHNGNLFIPYAMADRATGMARVEIDGLVDALRKSQAESRPSAKSVAAGAK